MTKYCIVCGSENFSRSKRFCCRKCADKYWFEQYYNNHKEEVLNKNKQWAKNNPERAREILLKYREKERNLKQ